MLGKQKLTLIAQKALRQAKKLGTTEAEVVIWNGDEELTRFANSMVHQSVSLVDAMVHVRAILGKKIGVARTNRLDPVGVGVAVEKALTLARLQQEDRHFVSLPNKALYQKTSHHYQKAIHIGPIGRVEAIDTIISAATYASLTASGAFSESASETLIANSRGVLAYQTGKAASMTAILTGEAGSGYASQSAKGGRTLDAASVARRAVFKATHGKMLVVEPGEYEVVLEPPAVAELMDFFAWLGPNARIYHEDVSFYQGNLGKQVFHDSLTIVDDPFHAAGYPVSFDYEGHPKKPMVLVDRGKLAGVVYDSYHAAKFSKGNTGHAMLAPNTWGPTPTHLVIKPGTKTVEDMIKNIKKGLLVTRFWYTRVVQHKQLTLTGMTRDGTFYIENGAIVGRVRNLRYTQSVVEALKDVRGIGRDLELHGSEGSPGLMPALHLGKFRFTGVTKHG